MRILLVEDERDLNNLIKTYLEKEGYKEGLTIAKGKPSSGIGGGMCQLSNLIHWMILHTDMEITEHHHHDQIDLFPDFKRWCSN